MNIYQEIANLYATQVEIYKMKTELLFKCNYCGHEQKGDMKHLGKKPNCPDCTDHPIMRIVKPKCISCGKPVNENTSLAGEFVHEKCIKVKEEPPQMCHKCDLPIYVSNTKKWPDGFYYHDKCKQHTPGAKLDHDKPRLGLVLGNFSRALMQVGKVGTMGAKKYTPNGWVKVENGVERYTDAMVRHYLTEETGEKFDPELTEMAGEDIYHAACVAWNALARLELMIRKKEAQHAQLEMDKQ